MLFAVRANPRSYWFDKPWTWIQFNLFVPVIDGSIGQGLEWLLQPGKSLEVATSGVIFQPDSIPDFGAGAEIEINCTSSDILLGPAPNGDNAIVVRSFESFATEADTTYRVTLDFDLELYGAREIVDDLLPWSGSLQFDYVEDRG